jgi:hypothetical protein
MTVQQLIEELQRQDPKATVVIYQGHHDESFDIQEVSLNQLIYYVDSWRRPRSDNSLSELQHVVILQ